MEPDGEVREADRLHGGQWQVKQPPGVVRGFPQDLNL